VFDAPFFNMTSTEVNGSDPQQLHMLEVSYEALENGTATYSYPEFYEMVLTCA
jgi:acyl transferase domain-containing protein